MSRLAKKPIILPTGTEASVSGRTFRVKGPKGELSRDFNTNLISIAVTDGAVNLERAKKIKETEALWGTYASHVINMIQGVTSGYQKKLILEGVGFKSEVKGKQLVLDLGFSHKVIVDVPDALTVTAEKNEITVSGTDKEMVGQFSAQLRARKKPEPYKGKGMRYADEVIRRKQGKKSVA